MKVMSITEQARHHLQFFRKHLYRWQSLQLRQWGLYLMMERSNEKIKIKQKNNKKRKLVDDC